MITTSSSAPGRRLTIAAAAAHSGDVYIDRTGSKWIVRNVGTPDDIGVTLRLAAGRSQRAEPEVFAVDELITVYRADA